MIQPTVTEDTAKCLEKSSTDILYHLLSEVQIWFFFIFWYENITFDRIVRGVPLNLAFNFHQCRLKSPDKA